MLGSPPQVQLLNESVPVSIDLIIPIQPEIVISRHMCIVTFDLTLDLDFCNVMYDVHTRN